MNIMLVKSKPLMLGYKTKNYRFLFLALIASLLTILSIQIFGPLPILSLYILPWLIILFNFQPVLLISLWIVLIWPMLVFPDMMFPLGPILFLPLDPAYFFGIIFLSTIALTRGGDVVKALKENPYLSLFLLIVLIYVIIYTPIHGKSAIGEARKYYFYFFIPIIVMLAVKEPKDVKRVLVATFCVALALLATASWRLALGSSVRGLANAPSSLFLLLTALSILIFHLNGQVIIHRAVDIAIFWLCLGVVSVSLHRSVLLAGASGLLIIFFLYRKKLAFLAKVVVALIVLAILLALAMASNRAFDEFAMGHLGGLINPQADATASWRMRGWQQQLGNLSGQSLLFGNGLGSYYSWVERGWKVHVTPHNGYVQIILKFGLIGLAVYILLAMKFFWHTFMVRKKLSPGPQKALVEMGILNFGAAHGYMMGYGIELIALIFFSLAIVAVRLPWNSWTSPRAT
jgi:hypothetical protein